ncbi:MAG TPA: EAL domain-containing protein [Acetobacteraceae bacterium]|nr:EAL domain-containing protein [Acetobacteraceae bacterium]
MRPNRPAHTEVAPGLGLKLVFTAFIGFLAAAALYASVLIAQRQTVLDSEARYNITWLTSQAGLELARLEAVIGASQVPNSGIDADAVGIWMDIVTNRLQVLTNGEVGSFIAKRPELHGIAADLATGMAAARALSARLDEPGTAGKLLATLLPLNPKLVRLSSVAYVLSSNIAARDLRELVRLQWIFSGLLGGLIICGFSLIGLLSWHNRLLKRAHTDLQRTGKDLRTRDVELGTRNAQFDAALNNMSQALCMADAEQHMIVCNVRFLELFGLSEAEVRPGTPVVEVFRSIHAAARYDRRVVETIWLEQQGLATSRRPWRFFQEDSGGRALSVSHQPMHDGGWVATYEDISERRQAEARIRFMAHHDALTGLPNRLLFRERMESALEQISHSGESLAVLCLDLDFFKDVNDTLGHPAGDALLESVARRLRACVRGGDLVARLGGDEFAILQFSPKQPTDAEGLAQRIVETLRQPYDIEGQPAIVSVSVGIAIAGESGAGADTLLKCADLALYRAKADGRGTYRFFEAVMDAEIQVRRAIELELREALARSELEVFYQPQFDLRRGQVCGFEALLRWRHPERGMIAPDRFIPIAEELRLIIPIGEWVLRKACADAAAWPDHIKIAVNLSPMQFRSENLVSAVERALQLSRVAAHRLEIEITESALLQNNHKVLSTLHQLRALGVRIALDDFGTGYSSLSYLRSFPFDKIKIDQSFVREIGSRPDCLAIVTAVTGLAHQLGMSTTAEGVETAEQLDELRDAGCDEVQGFYFDRPKPLSATFAWFDKSDQPAIAEPAAAA